MKNFLYKSTTYGFSKVKTVASEHLTDANTPSSILSNVMCNGNVFLEDHVYIGAGSVLKQGKPGEPLVIGKGAVVGMGAVVTKSVPAGATVVGNPARVMQR